MNPPFADKQDIAHVRHALGFLRPGGLLVAIMAAGVTFREDRQTADFRDQVTEAGGAIVPLPDGAFKESGTDVRTVLVTVPEGSEALEDCTICGRAIYEGERVRDYAGCTAHYDCPRPGEQAA